MNKNIHSQLRTMFERGHAHDKPGSAVIVVRDGKTLLRTAIGMADLEHGIALTPDSVFRIASVTKQFTGAAILLLQQRGKLSIGDRIGKHLRGYPTRGQAITIEHLLRHTSGIQSYTSMPTFWPLSQTHKTLQERIDFFKNEPMRFKPGERFEYNNSGYTLLGAIIEKVSGLDYAEFVRRNIFDKLGMRDTRYDSPDPLIKRRARGYQLRGDALGNADYLNMDWPYAAGALLSSVDDLARWDAALYTGKLISQRALQDAWTPGRLNNGEPLYYGYGWGLGAHQGLTCIEHSGGINGFQSFAIRIPERRVFVAMLSNGAPATVDPGQVAISLAALAAGVPIRKPRRVNLSRSQLAVWRGRYAIAPNGVAAFVVEPRDGALHATHKPGDDLSVLHPLGAGAFQIGDGHLRARFVTEDGARVMNIFDRDRVVLTAREAKTS